MDMDFDVCSEKTSNKIIKCSQRGKEFKINNKTGRLVNKVEVDGCLIRDGNEEKCDYLFEIDIPISFVYYVELKGKKLEKACEQLANTIRLCKERHYNIDKECYIISSRVPTSGTSPQSLKKQFLKKHKVQLFIHNRTHTVNI